MKLPPERPRDAAAEGGLADTGRAEQAENRPLFVLLELADGEVFEDALLDLFEAVVILVEDLAHRGNLEVVRRLEVPGNVQDPVEVRAHHGVLGRAHLHVAEAFDLLLRDLLGLGGEACLGDAVFEAVEIALVAVVLAELFLDGLELLAEHVLALILAHLLLDLGVDALAHFQDLELAREKLQHLADALFCVDRLEELGFLFDGGVQVGGHEVREGSGRLDRVDQRARFTRKLGHELDDLLGDVTEAHAERFGFVVLGLGLVEADDLGFQVRPGLRHFLETNADDALEDERVVARAVLERLEDARRTTDGVEIFRAWIVRRRVLLSEDGNDRRREVVDVLHERDRFLTADVERGHVAREEHRVADGEDGELVAEGDRLVVLVARGRGGLFFRHDGDLSGGLAPPGCAHFHTDLEATERSERKAEARGFGSKSKSCKSSASKTGPTTVVQ